MPRLTKCPTCGSTNIKVVRKTWASTYLGVPYKVPRVRFSECPDCGEQVFDPDAVRKIEAHRPAPAQALSRVVGMG